MSYRYLQSVNGLVMDIANVGGIQSGSRLQAISQKNEANQWWETQSPAGEEYFWILSGEPGLVVDIDAVGGIQSGSRLQVLNQKNEANQWWTFEPVTGQPDYFWIVSHADPSLVIGIDNADSYLQVQTRAETDNQYWAWAPAAIAPTPGLGGNGQYVLTSQTPIMDLVVEIDITEAIVVSPTSGGNPSSPGPWPIGFQINGVSPKTPADKETAGDQTITWMQFGAKMWPETNTLASFAEYWPPGVEQNPNILNTFNLSTKTPVLLPDNLTIPAGWRIRFTFTKFTDGTITGFDCTVADVATGAQVGPDMGINLLDNQPLAAPGAGTINFTDLAQWIAFQVVLVGFWDGDQATLLSGAGTITCTASTPLTPGNAWPSNESGGTAENTNSTYGLLPAAASTSITQYFGVAPASTPTLEWATVGNTQGRDGGPSFGNTQGDPTWIGDFTGSGKSEVLFYSPGDGNWWLARYVGAGFQWVLVSNTQGQNGPSFGNTQGDPTWIGDFTGSGKSEVLFYSPGDGNWWLARYVGAFFQWDLVSNTQGQNGPSFGNTQNDPTWIGDFTGSGKSEVLFYSPGDGNWWLASYVKNAFQWTKAGKVKIPGAPTWLGDFTGTKTTQVLLYAPSGTWWLLTDVGGTYKWANLGNTQGGDNGPSFGNTAGDPTWIGDFTGSGKSQVLFYSPGDGNWWLGKEGLIDSAGTPS